MKYYNCSFRPLIHLYIRGNCGNQFFQYAFARYLQKVFDGDLVINYYYYKDGRAFGYLPESDNLLSLFKTYEYKYTDQSDFGLIIFKGLKFIQSVFGLRGFEKRTYKFYLLCAKILPKFGVYYFDSAYYPFKLYRRRNIYICGYFESSRYFDEIDDIICGELLPRHEILDKNKDIYSKILARNSVCVTIKRRDVDNEEIADIYQYDISYFPRAIDYFKSAIDSPLFCVFSDDVNWCRDNLDLDCDVWFESDANPIWEKIRLMSACKHFIIHNSTFSWWVQHLSRNPDKIVIAPSKWMLRDDQPIDLYEKGWIYQTPDGVFTDQHD